MALLLAIMMRKGKCGQIVGQFIAGPLGLIAAIFRQAIYDTRSRNAVLAAEALYFLNCPETDKRLADMGIEPDYFHRLLVKIGVW